MKPGSVKSKRPKNLNKKSVKKVFGNGRNNGITLMTTYPSMNDETFDDSSFRSLSSSYSGFSNSVSRLDQRIDQQNTQQLPLFKVNLLWFFDFLPLLFYYGNYIKSKETQGDIGVLKIQLSELLEENSILKNRWSKFNFYWIVRYNFDTFH